MKFIIVRIRDNPDWKNGLPKNNWVVFTIANKEDEDLVAAATKICLDKDVSYTCNGRLLALTSETYFDEEITWRAFEHEKNTGEEFNFEFAPITTAHQNFSEGFWFASTLAYDDKYQIDKLVCLDFTKNKVRKHLLKLIDKINNDWLPSHEDIELPVYDP